MLGLSLLKIAKIIGSMLFIGFLSTNPLSGNKVDQLASPSPMPTVEPFPPPTPTPTPTPDPDPIIDCVDKSGNNFGKMRSTTCNNGTSCEINGKWSFYESPSTCKNNQNKDLVERAKAMNINATSDYIQELKKKAAPDLEKVKEYQNEMEPKCKKDMEFYDNLYKVDPNSPTPIPISFGRVQPIIPTPDPYAGINAYNSCKAMYQRTIDSFQKSADKYLVPAKWYEEYKDSIPNGNRDNACSDHGGVSCVSEMGYFGQVRCKDGYGDSKVHYLNVKECLEYFLK